MKLAIVTRTFPPDVTSGRETVIYNLWRQAAQCDDVTLISGWRHDVSLLPKTCLPIDQSSPSRIVNYARFFLQSAYLVRRIQPDVVLSNAIELGPVNRPSVVIVYDFNFGRADDERGSQMFRRAVIGWRLRAFDRLVPISQATANQLAVMGLDCSRISVVPLGVDFDRFHAVSDSSSEQLCVVYPSRITRGKGQHIAIEALQSMDETLRAQVKLIIVGYVEDHHYLRQLETAAADLPVEFHTNVADIVPYYQSADIVIFPTLMEEGFGFTAAEAMACGKPVICSDYPAIREATGGIGVPVSPGDVANLARAITSLLQDPERREALGKAGLAYAQAHYDWTGVYQQYRQVLSGLASDRQRS